VPNDTAAKTARHRGPLTQMLVVVSVSLGDLEPPRQRSHIVNPPLPPI